MDAEVRADEPSEEAEGQVADAGVLVAAAPLHRSRAREPGAPSASTVSIVAISRPGECRPEAVVDPVAEGEVRVGVSADVEAVRIREHGLVAFWPGTSGSSSRRRGSSRRRAPHRRVAVRRL